MLNLPLRIIHARISNNLNKEFIMMTKFTAIHVQHSFVFKDTQLFYFVSNNFRFRATGICQTIMVAMPSVS